MFDMRPQFIGPHRFFPIDQSVAKFYRKPIFSHILDSVFHSMGFSSFPIEFLSVFECVSDRLVYGKKPMGPMNCGLIYFS